MYSWCMLYIQTYETVLSCVQLVYSCERGLLWKHRAAEAVPEIIRKSFRKSKFNLWFLAVNTYLFMMQAQGIMIRENMRTIGAQVYEQVVRSAYAKRNSSGNESGISINVISIKNSLDLIWCMHVLYWQKYQAYKMLRIFLWWPLVEPSDLIEPHHLGENM